LKRGTYKNDDFTIGIGRGGERYRTNYARRIMVLMSCVGDKTGEMEGQ